MSDYLVPDGTNTPYNTTEHYHKRVLAGDPESVRFRLVDAMERLGYDILDDETNIIRGRRGARGWASAYASADVLDYPMTLIVRLKPNGPHATRATFDYLVKHPSLSRGEVAILTREAETISSLAMVRSLEKICPACGSEATDESRFCRQCGSPMTVQNRDLEYLRMAAEVRAGYTSVVATTLVLAASTLLIGGALLAMLLSGVVFTPGLSSFLVIGLVASVINTFFSAFGWNRISRALKLKHAEPSVLSDHRTAEFAPPARAVAAEPRQLFPPSAIEATTNLLGSEPASRVTGSFGEEGTPGQEDRFGS